MTLPEWILNIFKSPIKQEEIEEPIIAIVENRNKFFENIKHTLFNNISSSQESGVNDVLDSSRLYNINDDRYIAYILATIYHETKQSMQPVGEANWVKEPARTNYLKGQKYYPYYGRDLVQTTWDYNYKKVKDFTGIDVISNPDLIGQMPLASKVAVYFMVKGWYTTHKLSEFFTDTFSDPVNARKIINPKDYTTYQKIASYYKLFLDALKEITFDEKKLEVPDILKDIKRID